jgi:hypothetical protein
LTFPGATLTAPPEPLEEQAARISYFVGRDPAKWRQKAPLFGRVRYRDLYPGIDVEFYGVREQAEFDFVLHPGADPTVISLELEGADRIEQTSSGGLTAHIGGLAVQLRLPRVYQPGIPDSEVEAAFELLAENRIRFRVGEYDATLPLVIDPTLSFSTFLGEINSDNAQDVALDAAGNVYFAGVTHGRNFGEGQGSISAPDLHAFIAKLNRDGTHLEYAVVLGGGLPEEATAITVDSAGNAYAVGSTFSSDFPVTADALQPEFAGGNTDVFVVKISPSGELLYSTYLGGSRQDEGKGIGVDGDGHIAIVGTAISDDFPLLPGALRTFKSGDFHDGFIAKLDIENRVLMASTFLGGTGRDEILDLALDTLGNVVVTGITTSPDFPTSPQAPQPFFAGVTDAFVTKFNPEISEILFSTFLASTWRDALCREIFRSLPGRCSQASSMARLSATCLRPGLQRMVPN